MPINQKLTDNNQYLQFACPICKKPIAQNVQEDKIVCQECGGQFSKENNIWNFLPPERIKLYSRFIREYETVRMGEMRGSHNIDYYRKLPFQDTTGRFTGDWGIRSRTFTTFLEKVLIPFESEQQSPLRILDQGAGNCWLSYQLAKRGHTLGAIDLLVNDWDGLGAAKYYDKDFLCLQAEFGNIPIADTQVDLIIFNASFHYTEQAEDTLVEALRVLSYPGKIIIMDTPIYTQAESGEKMVAERQAEFISEFGFPSNSLSSENFLTYRRIEELGQSVGIRWNIIYPYYGLRWWMRPLVHELRRKREPADFALILGERITY